MLENENLNQSDLCEQLENGSFILPHQMLDALLLGNTDYSQIHLCTMSYFPVGNNSQTLHEFLIEQSLKGTEVTLTQDASYGLHLAPATDFPPLIAKMILGSQATNDLIARRNLQYKRLKEANVSLRFTGDTSVRRIIPFAGADHRKILLVEQDPGILSSGIVFGYNINNQLEPGTLDSGTYFNDPYILEWLKSRLYSEYKSDPTIRTFNNGFTLFTREITENGGYFADGEINQLIEKAQHEIILISQFLPDGNLLEKLILSAKKGVQVNIVSNSPEFPKQYFYMLKRKLGSRKLDSISKAYPNFKFHVPIDPTKFIHMKGLIVDSNSKFNASAITGTDCMTNEQLQKWGTREILIRMDNPEIVKNFSDFYKMNILSLCCEFSL